MVVTTQRSRVAPHSEALRRSNVDSRSVSRAVILAAGEGTRLQPLTADLPKCLVKVDGKPLLMRALDALASQGVDEAVIVIGDGGDTIRERIGKSYAELAIHYVEAPHYETTNNIRSLWDARRYLDQDILLLEADVVFDPEVVGALLGTPGSSAAVAPFRRPLSGTVVHRDGDNQVTSFTLGSEQGPGLTFGTSTARGSGDHQRIGWPSSYQGKMPWAYAASSRPGRRLPPAASSPFGSSSASATGGKATESPESGIQWSLARMVQVSLAAAAAPEGAGTGAGRSLRYGTCAASSSM